MISATFFPAGFAPVSIFAGFASQSAMFAAYARRADASWLDINLDARGPGARKSIAET